MRSAAVIVASTSAEAGTSEDTTGPVIQAWLRDHDFACEAPRVVADGAPVGEAVATALESRPAVIITTGGTGLSPDDRTPEELTPLIDTPLPGFGEELRRRGTASSARSLLSRAESGFAGPTLIIALPGSRGGVSDGLALLGEILEHALAQRHGRDDGAHRPR